MILLFAAGLLAALGLLRVDEVISSSTAKATANRSPLREPRRIVSLAPNITETCFALGAGERVVGVTDYCTYPPQATVKTSVGTLLSPNFEVLLSLQPDLVIGQEPNENVATFCQQHNVPFAVMKMHDLTSIRDGIIQLGHLLNRQAAADELVLYIDATLDAVTPPPGMTPPRTLVCIGRTPGSLQGIYSLGQHDFLAQLLTKAGGQNLFDDVERRYPMVSKEAILSRQPEIIIDTFPGVALTASQRQRVKDDWQAFPTLPAVRNNRVFVLTDEYLHIPGPRVAQTARKLAEICQAGAVR